MPPPEDPIPPLKEQLARVIVDHIDGWPQYIAADRMRTDQPRVSDLRNGCLDRFSLAQLIRFITRLHGKVVINTAFGYWRRWLETEVHCARQPPDAP